MGMIFINSLVINHSPPFVNLKRPSVSVSPNHPLELYAYSLHDLTLTSSTGQFISMRHDLEARTRPIIRLLEGFAGVC